MKTKLVVVFGMLFVGVSALASSTYCTLWTEGKWSETGRPPIGLTCLQADGSWKNLGGFPEAPTAHAANDNYSNASVAEASNGDVLLGYSRILYPKQDQELMLARFNSQQGWSLLSQTPVNTEGQNLLPALTQFGGKVFDLLGVPYFFWNQNEFGFLSTLAGNSWSQTRFSRPGDENGFRYPEVLHSGSGNMVYLYYTEPSPTIISFDGVHLNQIAHIPTDLTKEWTLESSLAEWNGQLAMAYVSSNMPQVQDFTKSRTRTKIAFYNGSSWKNVSSKIEDTSGRNFSTPFLFTAEKSLYIMYQDYSTVGVPDPTQGGPFRFRVKQWTGSRWKKVGSESDPISYSTRTEYLNDNGMILVNVIQPAPIGGYRQVVIQWSGGKFSYAGKQIRSLPNLSYPLVIRPGAVVRLRR